jgi:hypothetical protein
MKTRRILQLAIVLLVALMPALAFAHAPQSAFQSAVAGSVLDPHQSTLIIEPGKGMAVMVYEDGDLKGWFLKPGAVTVQPNHVYGVLATRGSSVVFHSGLLVRAGATKVSWAATGNRPAVAFRPAFSSHGYSHAHAHRQAARPAGVRHAATTPRAATTKAAPAPAKPSIKRSIKPSAVVARKKTPAGSEQAAPKKAQTLKKAPVVKRASTLRLDRGGAMRALARGVR